MSLSAILFMLFGMVFLWGGLTVAILHNQHMEKKLGKLDNYHE